MTDAQFLCRFKNFKAYYQKNSSKKEYLNFGLSNESFESVVVGGLEVQVRMNTCALFNQICSFTTH